MGAASPCCRKLESLATTGCEDVERDQVVLDSRPFVEHRVHVKQRLSSASQDLRSRNACRSSMPVRAPWRPEPAEGAKHQTNWISLGQTTDGDELADMGVMRECTSVDLWREVDDEGNAYHRPPKPPPLSLSVAKSRGSDSTVSTALPEAQPPLSEWLPSQTQSARPSRRPSMNL
mmetsp:Transcript_23441/g.54612  ORF Transcript_23441/g.54612 Transcript_23441/m.54612 type:complete len:175 (-) Transcript_23441:9-533(-)